MHMGPDDPLFAGSFGMQRPGRPGMNPAGARYDPIGPPGMPVSLLFISTGLGLCVAADALLL